MSAFFSFDTSAFLNGRRDLVPPEIFPTLWNNLEMLIGSGDIRAIDVVKDELTKRDDEVGAWTKAQGDLFVPLSLEIQQAVTTVLEDHPKLMGAGGGRNAADPFVIALAIAYDGIVVTEETSSGRITKPRIPDVCHAMSVPCVNLIGFVRTQGWTY